MLSPVMDFNLFMVAMCICATFFVPSSVDGHVGCFHFLAVVNSDAVNMGIQMSLHYTGFIFSGHIHSNWIA